MLSLLLWRASRLNFWWSPQCVGTAAIGALRLPEADGVHSLSRSSHGSWPALTVTPITPRREARTPLVAVRSQKDPVRVVAIGRRSVWQARPVLNQVTEDRLHLFAVAVPGWIATTKLPANTGHNPLPTRDGKRHGNAKPEQRHRNAPTKMMRRPCTTGPCAPACPDRKQYFVPIAPCIKQFSQHHEIPHFRDHCPSPETCANHAAIQQNKSRCTMVMLMRCLIAPPTPV